MHTFDLGERVTIFQLDRSKGLTIEGRATIHNVIDGVDEQYVVKFDDEPHEKYERFIDVQGQDNPEQYIREFNKKIGYV